MQRSGKANGAHAIRAGAYLCLVLLLSSLAVLTISWLTMAAAYPTKPIQLVAAGDPGGGLDLLARAMEQALRAERLVPQTITIVNLGGGGGNLARSYVAERRGDDHTLLVESNRIYLNPILGTTRLSVKDFTSIARMMTEYVVVAVRADSRFRTVKDLMDELRRDPRSVSFGVGTVPSDDQLNILRAVQAAGINPAQVRIVVFRSGGDLMTQLLGGHVDVISTGLSEALPQFQSGAVRLLAVSAPERLGGELATIPTWRDAGIDSVVYHWRGVFGPPGMSQEAVRFWTETLDRMRKTPTWRAILERNQWFDAFVAGDDFRRSLEEEAAVAEALLRQVGLAK